jgi:hypothetical protein
MTAFSSLIGGHMDNKAKGFLSELGLLEMKVSPHAKEMRKMLDSQTDPEMKKALSKMGVLTPITASLNDQNLDLFAHRPDKFINDVMVPAIRKKYGMDKSDEEIALIISKNFNRNTSDFLGEHIVNGSKFAKDASIFQKSMGFGEAYEYYLKSPEGAEEAASKSWKNLTTVIGTIYLPKITSSLLLLANGLTKLSGVMTDYPRITKALIYGFIALAGALAFSGTLLLLRAGFSGLALAGGLLQKSGVLTLLTNNLSTLGKSAGIAGAAFLGWELGSWFSKAFVEGTKFSDWLGSFIAHILAFFGNSEAKAAIKANTGKEFYQFGGNSEAKAAIKANTGKEFYQFGGNTNYGKEDPNGYYGPAALAARRAKSNVTTVAAAPNSQPIHVTTQINLDGKKIAESTTKHQAKSMSGPQTGSSQFDGQMGMRLVGSGLAGG